MLIYDDTLCRHRRTILLRATARACTNNHLQGLTFGQTLIENLLIQLLIEAVVEVEDGDLLLLFSLSLIVFDLANFRFQFSKGLLFIDRTDKVSHTDRRTMASLGLEAKTRHIRSHVVILFTVRFLKTVEQRSNPLLI